MAQEILNNVSAEWKRQAKHIRFLNGTNNPSFANNKIDIYFGTLDGELSLSQFPKLKSIIFNNNNINVTSLESIDISENVELNKIVLSENNSNHHALRNASCSLLIKERQLSQVVLHFYEYRYYGGGAWIERYKLLKYQTII